MAMEVAVLDLCSGAAQQWTVLDAASSRTCASCVARSRFKRGRGRVLGGYSSLRG